MEEGLRRLYTGNFNTMSQESKSDGSRVITLHKDGENKIYRFRVKDLYGENEEVLEHEEIDFSVSPRVLERIKMLKEEVNK